MALYRNIAGVDSKLGIVPIVPIIDPDTSTLPDPEGIPGVPNLGGEVDLNSPITDPAPNGTQPAGGATPIQTTPNNFLPLVAIAGVLAVVIGGDTFIRRGSKIVFAGGIGALFYLLNRKPISNG